jgi:hypothetical protein
MYKKSGSDGEGGESIAIFSMYSLSSAKALLCLGSHSIVPLLFSALQNGRLRSADLEMNLFKAATRTFNFWMSFLVLGSSISLIALILSGLASILLAEMNHPKIFPFVTPNTHFSGFNFKPALLMLMKVSAKSLT